MRARSRRSRSQAPSRSRFGALAALFLLLGLLAPLAPLAPAAPAAAEPKPGNPPPLPAPTRVNVAGSFQTLLGCPADYDKTCQISDLQDPDGDGTWTGFLPIPPGSYTYRLVVSSDIDRSLGEGGDPDATDLSLQVPPDAAGVYFAYNSRRGRIVAEPTPQDVQLTTDVGLAFPMAPTQGGDYELFFDGPAGTYGYTVTFNGEPVGQDTVALDAPARVHIVVDQQGVTTVKETVPGTLVEVVKLAAGQPQPGACFAVLQTDDSLIAQACDGDDGADGSTAIRIPNGLPPDRYVVSESFTPDGQEPAEDQRAELGPGQFQVEATVDGEAGPDEPAPEETPPPDEPLTEEPPTEEPSIDEPPTDDPGQQAPGQLVVLSVDAADPTGDPLPGACYLLDFAVEQCDGDEDGDVVFDAVAAGTHTLTETVAPTDYFGVNDVQFETGPEGGRIELPHERSEDAPPETPETPETPDTPGIPSGVGGGLDVTTVAEDGGVVTGACFALTSRDDPALPPVERCDDADGSPADGFITFGGIPAGRYRLDETVTPDGVQPAGGERVEIVEGQTAQLTVTYQAATADVGTLVILVEDESGAPLGETCFDLSGAADLADICDQGNDGRLNIPDIPAGDYLVTQTQTAEGYELAEPVEDVTVPPGGSEELTVVNPSSAAGTEPPAATAEPEPEPETGALRITTSQDGAPLPGACYAIVAATGEAADVCDDEPGDGGTVLADADPTPGVVLAQGFPPGDYNVTETRAPAGAAPQVAPLPATVAAGETTPVEFTIQTAPTPALGGVLVVVADESGARVAGTQVQLDGPTTVGPVRDGEPGDADARDGRILLENVDAGDYTLSVLDVPDPFAVPAPQPVAVAEGGEPTRVEVLLTAAAPTVARLTVLTVDEIGAPLGGACYTIANSSGTFGPSCDDEDGTGNGQVVFTQVVPGPQTLTQTRPPTDAAPATEPVQEITLEAGDDETLTFVSGPAVGAVEIAATGPDGAPVADLCYSLDGAQTYEVCDGQLGDGAPDDPGLVRIEDVTPGDYTLNVLDLPDEFDPPAPQPVTVAAGAPTEVDLPLAAAAPDVARLTLETVDEAGTPLGGACYTVANPAGAFGPFCDDENDGAGDGQVILPEVAPGPQTVTQTQAPTDGGPATEPVQEITLEAGDDETLTFVSGPALGAVEITATDAETDTPAAGGCYTLTGPQTYSVCDGQLGDGAPDDPGLVRVEDVAPGDYDVAEDSTPADHQPAAAPGFATVVAGETAAVAFSNAPTPTAGSVEVSVVDPDGTPIETIPGACFGLTGAAEIAAVCDNEPGDADPAAGVVRLDGVPAGTYALTQTRAADGFNVAADQPVDVAAGETTPVEVVNNATPPPVGAIVALVQGPDGALVGGACVTLTAPGAQGIELCDDAPADSDAEIGRIRFEGLTPGSYTAAVTTAPDGFQAGEPAGAEVPPGAVGEVVLTLTAAAPETGGVVLEVRDPDNNLVPHGCVALNTDGTQLGPFCDGGDEDAEPDEGVILLENLEEGVYEAVQVEPAPPEGGLAVASAASTGQTFTVEAGVVVRVIIIIILPPTTGDLAVTVRDERNRPLGGACFALIRGDGATEAEICDDDGADGDGNRGRVRFDAIAIGTYTLRQTDVEEGYEPAAEQQVAIEGGLLARITVRNEPTPAAVGAVEVLALAEDGGALTGACYALLSGATTVAGPSCDEEDGEDGATLFQDLAAGLYTVRETRTPADVAAGSDLRVTVVAGQTAEVRVGHSRRTGRLLIRKTDERGGLLGGACFRLSPDRGEDYRVCDNDASDDIGADGLIFLQGVTPGLLGVEEVVTPTGYEPGGPQEVTVEPGRRASLVFENVPLPPPPQVGNLTVFKVGEDGADLPGACFALLRGAATVAGPRCDGADGANDGATTFTGIAAGDLTLRETRRPGPGYAPIADIDVEVLANDTVEVEVENLLRPGRVLVRKTDRRGTPLQNACFDLSPDGRGPQCSDASGQITFDNLRPGTYTLTETRAPNGFLELDPIPNVVVNAGATTVVEVENQLAPPPPDTGSIQVVKFYCPAGAEGEGTLFVDSSDPGAGRLARTANCEQGNARFRLIAAAGEGGPGEFATGADGTYQTTLRAGDYTLTELDPDLPGDSDEAVRIGVNQLTTVVVINFVAPPAPAPAAVNVAKYTCDAGFQGTVFADFVANCVADATLTNNVVFRLSGAVDARRVTGDTGQNGRTGFGQLPAGEYALREEPPFAAMTAYAFCGLDANNPSFAVAGTTVGFRLQAGQTLTCTWFNVPDDLSETTGAIVVHKEVCDAPSYPANFDWYGECDPQGSGVQFSLAVFDGANFVPYSTGTTDNNGLLRFNRLQPGTYQLKEIGGTWCHAESDSVNARGDVIVRAGARANVWIFNCVDTKSPPNTGAGPAAWPADTGMSGGSGLAVALGLAWPLLGAAGWRLRRRWAA